MLNQAKQFLTSAQTWLIGGALAIAASFVLEYVQVQRAADRALALRQGPPEAVAIETFDPAIHTGIADEISLKAQVAFDQPIVVDMERELGLVDAVLFPLYAENDGDRVALGVLVGHAPSPENNLDERSFVASIQGTGANGTLVELNGRTLEPEQFRLIMQGALATTGGTVSDTFYAVKAFSNGRDAALALPEDTAISGLLFWTGIAMGLFAVSISFRDVAREVLPWGKDDVATDNGPTKTRRFQPLAGQGEIIEDLRPANEPRAPIRRAFGALFPND